MQRGFGPLNIKKNILFILITVLLDTLGIGLLVPIFPHLMDRFGQDPMVASEHFGVFIGSYALMQFLAAPVLGALSDRFGRKIILLGSLLGATLDYLFMAYAPSFFWLIFGRLISGITGASITVATAYMVDVSENDDRSYYFGLIGAAWGLGFIAGPLLGASLETLGPKAPFLAAAGINLLNFFFGFIALAESLPPDKRRSIVFTELNPFRSIFKALIRSQILVPVWIYFLIYFAGQALTVNWYLYTELKFHWSSMQLGFSLSFIGLVVVFSQGVLTRVLIPRWGELKSVSIGILFYALCYLLFSLATHEWMIYATILLFALTGIATPALQTVMTKLTAEDEQGELQGTLVSLESLASVIAPIIFTPIFMYFTRASSGIYFPGVIFFISSMIALLTLGLWWGYRVKQKNQLE